MIKFKKYILICDYKLFVWKEIIWLWVCFFFMMFFFGGELLKINGLENLDVDKLV